MTDTILPTPSAHATREPSLGDFLFAVKQTQADAAYWSAYLLDKYAAKAALAESSGPTGGYLIPLGYSEQIYNVAAPISIVRPRATVIPMTTRTLVLPFLDQMMTPAAGTSALIGNMVLAWGTEGQSSETEPVFRAVELVAQKLTAYAVSSHELDEDSSPTMDVIMTAMFARALAWYEDANYIGGDGVGRVLGVMNAPCTLGVTRNTAVSFKQQDVALMVSKLHPNVINARSAVWVVHPTVLPQILTMTGVVTGDMLQLGGFPVKASEHCAPLGSPGDVLLCDFSHYVIGERHELSIAISTHLRFNSDQDVYRMTYRGAGQPWLSGPVTLKDGSTQVSAFVRLV